MTFKEFFQKIINEDQLEDVKFFGNWDRPDKLHRYDRASVKMLTNPNNVERIKNKWSKFDHSIDIYFVKSSQASKHVEVGQVDADFPKRELNIDIKPDPDKITLIITNNVGSPKIPLTPWILAHRFGHAIRRDYRKGYFSLYYYYEEFSKNVDYAMADIAHDLYNIQDWKRLSPLKKKKFAEAIGTFASARNNKLRDYGEFINELLAQYVITGEITLNNNPPKHISTRKVFKNSVEGFHRNRDIDDEETADLIGMHSRTLSYYASVLFGSVVGSILVM